MSALTVSQLISLLRQLPPRAIVTTWAPPARYAPVDGEDDCVEQVLLAPATPVAPDGVVVLGLDIDGDIVEGAELYWAAHDTAANGIEQAQAKWAKARREQVG